MKPIRSLPACSNSPRLHVDRPPRIGVGHAGNGGVSNGLPSEEPSAIYRAHEVGHRGETDGFGVSGYVTPPNYLEGASLYQYRSPGNDVGLLDNVAVHDLLIFALPPRSIRRVRLADVAG